MLSIKMALRNLRRNRIRTLVTFLGICLSLALVQTYHNLAQGTYSNMVERGVRSGSGHIAVMRSGYFQDHAPGLCFAPAELQAKLAALPGVTTVLPRVYLTALAQSGWGSRRVSLVGTDMAVEATSNPFLQHIPKETFTPEWDEQGALVGKRLVRGLKIGLNRPLVMTVQSLDGDLVSERFMVRGIIDSGIREVDSSLVLISGPQAARMAGIPGQVHELSLVLDGVSSQKTVKPLVEAEIASRPDLQALDWETTMPNLYSAIRWEYVSVIILSVILLCIVTMGVANTSLMSVMERMREFGVIRSLGASLPLICRMVLAEALALSSMAVIAGVALSSLATLYLSIHGFDLRPLIPENLEFGGVIYSALLYAQWDIPWMVGSSLFMIVLCAIASLYPALKASRVTPVAAMRCC